jgi:succinate dehydrogenase / fumarate reductase membrane anchor subunit
VNSVALLVLGLWFAVAIAGLDSYDHAAVAAWIASPFNAIMLLLLSTTMVWHSLLGVQVVIEDYVHGPALKVFSLVLSKFVHAFLGIAAAFAVLKVFLGGEG